MDVQQFSRWHIIPVDKNKHSCYNIYEQTFLL